MSRLPGPLRPLFPVLKRMVVASTEVLGPITRRLPGRQGPPRAMAASTPEYAAAHPGAGIEVREVFPAVELRWPVPPGQPAGHWVFAAHRQATVPPAFVACIPQGRAIGPYGAVVTNDDTLLFDLSPYYGAFRPAQHPIFLRGRLPEVVDEPGSVGVLTTRGVDNYYHFVTDVLPRVELLRGAGVAPDRYLVNSAFPFQTSLLERVGIDPAQVIESSALPHLRAEELVVATLPDNHLRTPPWVTDWLRQMLMPEVVGPPAKRLYLTRGRRRHTRRVENEDAVVAALGALGSDALDPGALPVDEQLSLFAQAEVVVAPHGAGLTNLVFCQPGATVVELFAPQYVNVCYWNLAATVEGLRYRYLVCGDSARLARLQLGVDADITVDIRALIGCVESVLSER